ncbi:MAG TPA: Hrp-dependent type III effector protein, partial [Lachnospiraceae bacterium]|nr:Hrp-dependent type III effector protein [Lachnospiraceae bacterium]
GCEKKSKGECAAYLAKAIAEIIFRIKSKLGNEIGGLYISGGDISTAFCEKVKAVGFDVQDEVVPLAIYSKLLGGAFDQTPIITKGGLVGDDTTLITCVDYLRNKISGFSKAL